MREWTAAFNNPEHGDRVIIITKQGDEIWGQYHWWDEEVANKATPRVEGVEGETVFWKEVVWWRFRRAKDGKR